MPHPSDEQDQTPFHVKKAAQDAKRATMKNVQNPQVLQHANPPNAGGQNRDKGDRKARQNDRATNGGE